jgi:hypothetical protein
MRKDVARPADLPQDLLEGQSATALGIFRALDVDLVIFKINIDQAASVLFHYILDDSEQLMVLQSVH